MKAFHSLLVLVLVASIAGTWPRRAVVAQLSQSSTQGQPPAEQVDPDPWPKSAQSAGTTYTLYQPQLQSWDGYNLAGHAAVSVRGPGAKADTFGAIVFSAVTIVDRESRTVRFQNIQIQKVNFPSAPDQAAQYQKAIQTLLTSAPAIMPLDRLQALIGVLQAQQKASMVPVKNDPPNIIFSQAPAVLVLIDGPPQWSDIPNTTLARAINTRALLLRDQSRKLYIHLFDGFVEASDLSGPWTVGDEVPAGADSVAQRLAKENLVDLMEAPPDEKDPSKKPSLKNGAPVVYVETAPSELIVIQGKPDWQQITGTKLLYVNNSSADIVKDLDNQQTYVLVSGRWFSAPSLTGPWQYVAGSSLPPDFAKIPDDSPKENLKASVPGTPQAQEAVIATQIPQTATVSRDTAKFTPQISGEPDLKPIQDTQLSYVFNSADPIIQVSPSEWYAVHNGVWFNATSIQGPWLVASSVPPVIYSIPPSSPVYYVTYVKVYGSTPADVAVGYTPGYLGSIVSSDGNVVYGSGYQYPAYYSPTAYYPVPATYGYSADLSWTPWLGWAWGFGLGWAWGAAASDWDGAWGWGLAPAWGAYAGYYRPYGAAYGARGAAAWGPGGWAATSGNLYHHYGATTAMGRTSGGFNAWTGNAWGRQVGRSYNSTTGRLSAGSRGAVQNVYTGNSLSGARGATYNPTTGRGAAGERATFTNAETGKSTTAGRGAVTGPRGTTQIAGANDHYLADHDGNVYKGNPESGFQRLGANGWSSVDDRSQVQSLASQLRSRDFGAMRSAGSSWGGNWGGFNRGGGFGDRFGGGGFGDRFGGWGGGRFGGFGGGGFRGGFGGFHGGFGGFHGGRR